MLLASNKYKNGESCLFKGSSENPENSSRRGKSVKNSQLCVFPRERARLPVLSKPFKHKYFFFFK